MKKKKKICFLYNLDEIRKRHFGQNMSKLEQQIQDDLSLVVVQDTEQGNNQ